MPMRTRPRLVTFALLALLAHGLLFVAVRSRLQEQPAEPLLGGEFVERRPVRQQDLRRALSLMAGVPLVRPWSGHPLAPGR